MLATNTMHQVASAIEDAVGVPLLHIADATAEAIEAAGLATVGLLGTRFTMEQAFYKDRLREQHGLRVIVPPEGDRALVHGVIYDELCLGQTLESSRAEYRRILAQLVDAGCRGRHPRVHRDRAAGGPRRRHGAALRHCGDPRPQGRGLGPGRQLTAIDQPAAAASGPPPPSCRRLASSHAADAAATSAAPAATGRITGCPRGAT